MTIHSIHIFDRKGATLFTKTYSRAASKQELHLQQTGSSEPGTSPLDEQRKLVFGMLFSLREIIGKLTPENDSSALHSVQTGAATLHSFETMTGLRFALYTSNDVPSSKTSTRPTKYDSDTTTARDALRHIYAKIWVESVVRSPLYSSKSLDSHVVGSTTFEKNLDDYITALPWAREYS